MLPLYNFGGCSSAAAGVRGWFFRIAMSRLNIRIRNELFRSIVNQEIGFFDTIKTGDSSFVVVCLFVASALAQGVRGWFFTIVTSRLNIRIRNALFSSIMQQEMGFFDTVKTGDVTLCCGCVLYLASIKVPFSTSSSLLSLVCA